MHPLDSRTVFPEGLEQVLKSSIEGRVILANKNSLTEAHRKKLSQIIVEFLISKNKGETKGIGTRVLEIAAKEIEYLFPGEHSSSYYKPWINKKDRTGPNCRGKLWNRLLNMKYKIKREGIISDD